MLQDIPKPSNMATDTDSLCSPQKLADAQAATLIAPFPPIPMYHEP